MVAQEVKKLAGRTSAAADAVSVRIRALENSSDGKYASVLAMSSAFRSMRTIAATIAEELEAQLSATVSTLVDQALQCAVVTAVMVEELSGVAHGVTVGTSELYEQSHALNDEVRTLDEQVTHFIEFLKAV